MADYLGFAEANVGVSGRAKEVNESLSVSNRGRWRRRGRFPGKFWPGLKHGGVKKTANGEKAGLFSTTTQLAGGNRSKASSGKRLFRELTIMEALGVRIDICTSRAVLSGRCSQGGVSNRQQVEEGTAAADARHFQLSRMRS